MATEHFSYERFCSYFPVPRETYQKLDVYVSMISKWQKSVNLISGATLPDIWKRHIIDSYQLVGVCSSSSLVVDIGSGAGLPGIVLAIAGLPVQLVESDGKKVAFLREVVRVLSLDVVVHHQRVEQVVLPQECIITARAFARVAVMLALLRSTLTPLHKFVLLKGKNVRSELDEAEAEFSFTHQRTPSISDAQGVILSLSNIHSRGA